MARKLTLSTGVRTFQGLKELREARGEIKEQFAQLGEAFSGRKAKRDAGEEIPLWGDGEETRFDALGKDIDLVDAAIAEEERANEVAVRTAAARGQRQTRPPGSSGAGQDAGESRIVIPASCRRTGSLLGFRAVEDAYAAGQWVRGVLFGHEDARNWCRDHLPEESRAMSGTVLSKGGALVPNAMSAAIIDLVQEYGVALAECEVVPMTTDTLDWPTVTGGVTMYAVGENDEITESAPTTGSAALTARKFGVLVRYPSELDEDAIIDIGQLLVRKTAEAWSEKLDKCLFLGDGTSTYNGIKGIKNALAAGSKYTAATGNTAFATLDAADFIGCIGKMASWAEMGAKWYVSKAGWAASMVRLAEAAGGNTIDTVSAGMGRAYMGYPVRFAQGMNATLTAQTSTEGLTYLGDLRKGVIIGLRRQLRMRLSSERYMEYDQVGFLATVRFDVNVHDVGTATAAGGIIGLGTPSS
jgi:HK97 family phage major capsid protein